MRDPGFNTRTSVASPGPAAQPVPLPWDVLAAPAVEDLLPAAMNFWPRGAAFGTPDLAAADHQSTWSRLMRVLLRGFVDLYRRAFLLAREASPRTLAETLPEWERDYGLPEPCVTKEQSIAERIAALTEKVNSLPHVTPGDFIRLAAAYGFAVEIEEPAVFECGFSEVAGEHTVGDRLQEVYWIVRVQDLEVFFFRTGEGELAGDPLFSLGDAEQLLCLLMRYAPAWSIPVLEEAE